ncbi:MULTISPECIES: hypothetical protein [Anaeromyxobacter]|uniref:hypothetical protein n=1 Tax=Anaeromyxobacter TaxID=161492 RepID=UPI001F5A99B4|nr:MULTISPECIES: hypothetical protein [unclassified Anaeromyxobacter]
MPARILRFALEDLRARYADPSAAGVDPRTDTAPFRAFRAALLELAARAATAEAELSMWWDGTYNGYFLAVAVEPPEALAALDVAPACPPDDDRVAVPRADRYPLAHLEPGRAVVARDADGASFEAPFGAPSGHFGAPGMRRIP